MPAQSALWTQPVLVWRGPGSLRAQVHRVGESLATIGGGPVWGPSGLSQAQLDRALKEVEAAMEARGAALNLIRARALPTAAKEAAGAPPGARRARVWALRQAGRARGAWLPAPAAPQPRAWRSCGHLTQPWDWPPQPCLCTPTAAASGMLVETGPSMQAG